MPNDITKQRVKYVWTQWVAFWLVIVALLVAGNAYVVVLEDAKSRVIDAAAHTVPEIMTSALLSDQTNAQTLLTSVQQTHPSLVEATIVAYQDTDAFIIAQTGGVATATPATTPKNTTVAAIASPRQVILYDRGDGFVESSYAITDGEGSLLGYTEVLLNTQALVAPLERNAVRATRMFVIALAVVVIVFVWLLGTRRQLQLFTKLRQQIQQGHESIEAITHELLTPLTVMRGYVTMLTHEEALSEKGQKNIRRLDRASAQVEQFISNIQTANAIEAGTIQAVNTGINPIPVIEKAVTQATKKHATAIDIKIITKATGTMYADSELLQFVLEQLLRNALQHTDTGSISVITEREGGDVLIKIVDSGRGMEPHEAKHAFEKWYRAAHMTKDGVRGAGLGLWIAQHLVTQMKGTLSIDSEKGKGSTVTLRFSLTA